MCLFISFLAHALLCIITRYVACRMSPRLKMPMHVFVSSTTARRCTLRRTIISAASSSAAVWWMTAASWHTAPAVWPVDLFLLSCSSLKLSHMRLRLPPNWSHRPTGGKIPTLLSKCPGVASYVWRDTWCQRGRGATDGRCSHAPALGGRIRCTVTSRAGA